MTSQAATYPASRGPSFPPPARPTLGERVVEARGGIIFSVALHIVLATFLLSNAWKRPNPYRQPSEIVRVRFQEPPPEAPPPVPAPPLELSPSAAATERHNPDAPSDQPAEAPPSPSDPEVALIAPESAAPPEKGLQPELAPDEASDQQSLSAEEIAFLQAARQQREKREQKLEMEASRLSREMLNRNFESRAREWLADSGGAKDGVIRRLELTGYNDDIVERVLFKNGMEILYQHISAGEATGGAPIGSVTTSAGTYTAGSVARSGVYEIVRFSDKAFQRIAQLERQYMARYRLDPKKTRMISVIYGISNLGGNKGYDLVILKAEHQVIE